MSTCGVRSEQYARTENGLMFHIHAPHTNYSRKKYDLVIKNVMHADVALIMMSNYNIRISLIFFRNPVFPCFFSVLISDALSLAPYLEVKHRGNLTCLIPSTAKLPCYSYHPHPAMLALDGEMSVGDYSALWFQKYCKHILRVLNISDIFLLNKCPKYRTSPVKILGSAYGIEGLSALKVTGFLCLLVFCRCKTSNR